MRTLVTLSSSTLACTPAGPLYTLPNLPVVLRSDLTTWSEGFEAEVPKFIRSCCSKKAS
jgi:hypothetical protein